MSEHVNLDKYDVEEGVLGSYNGLRDRQDKDMDFYLLADYQLRDSDNQRVKAHDYTSNRPRVFADRVISSIASSDIQIVVTKDEETDDKSYEIEMYLRKLYKAIDAQLAIQKQPPLLEILAGQISIRGSIAAVCYPTRHNGFMIPTVTPWDTRYANRRVGKFGVSYAGYRTYRTKVDIESEYDINLDELLQTTPNKLDKKTNLGGYMLTDTWDEKNHEIYVQNKLLNASKVIHGLDYTPVLWQDCGAAMWFKDDDFEKYVGESIYAPVRGIFDVWCKLVTLLNTLTFKAAFGGKFFPNEGGTDIDVEEDINDDNVIVPVGPNDKFFPMPLNDIKNATVILREILDQELLFGSLPAMEYGQMSDSETVAQITTKASKTASVMKPRRVAIETFYDEMAYMLFHQIKKRKLPSKMKIRGRVITLPPIPWTEEYEIKHVLNVINPQQDIANAALAQALAPFIPLEMLLEKFIQVDDVTGTIRKKDKEDIEKIMPQIKIFRVAAEKLDDPDPEIQAEGAMLASSLGLGAPEEQGQKDQKTLGRNPMDERTQNGQLLQLTR